LVQWVAQRFYTDQRNVAKDRFVPFHPGAVRYYREIGIGIPDALTATN
jgi:TRAP-type uncharacterized transport system substrate-binding protein